MVILVLRALRAHTKHAFITKICVVAHTGIEPQLPGVVLACIHSLTTLASVGVHRSLDIPTTVIVILIAFVRLFACAGCDVCKMNTQKH